MNKKTVYFFKFIKNRKENSILFMIMVRGTCDKIRRLNPKQKKKFEIYFQVMQRWNTFSRWIQIK